MIIIATFGTSDSGKTTLIQSLTSSVMQKYKLEKVKAITLKVNYAQYTVEEKDRYFLDLPGHKTFALETMRNIFNIDVPLYVIDCEGFKNIQKRKTILKHYGQYFSLFKFQKLDHILIFNKAECVTKTELLEYYNYIKKQYPGNYRAYPVCALEPSSVSTLKHQLETVLKDVESLKTDKQIMDSKTDNPRAPVFKTIKSFDVNPPGKWLNEVIGGVLGGIKKRPILEGELLCYFDRLLNCWNKIVVKKVQDVCNDIVTIETLSDPYFFKNDQFKGVLFFKYDQVGEVQKDYIEDIKIKINTMYKQAHKDTKVCIIIDGQIAEGTVKSYKNNILNIRLKKEFGLLYAPVSSKVILLQEDDTGLQKLELCALGAVKE